MEVVERPAVERRSVAGDPWWIAGLCVLALGVVVHAVSAVRGGWIPSGDDGFWSIMSRSVFSDHPPLLGSSSSGGLVDGDAYHHLGPLGFYLLAPFVALFGGVGVALGAASINAASLVVAAVAVRLGAGRRAGWFVLWGGALLSWTMGSELLVDPWNPHLATLPLWCGLGCAWAVLCGRRWWAVPGIVALSLSLQTHLSFVAVAGFVALVTLVACAYWCRSVSSEPGEPGESSELSEPGGGRRVAGVPAAWLPLCAALVAGLVANLATLIQQFFGAGPGNLTLALGGSAAQDDPIGVVSGARALSQPFLSPVNWLPGSWRPQAVPVADLAPPWLVVVVVLVAAALGVVAVRRRRWRDVVVLAFAVALCAVGLLTTSKTAIRTIGVPLTLVRWAWPTALFVQIVVLETGLRLWSSVRRDADDAESAQRAPVVWTSVVALALTVVLVGANLPARDEGSGAKAASRDAINEVIGPAAARIAQEGTPLIELSWNTLAAETAVALMDLLDEQGIHFTVDDPVVLRQVGARHRRDGSEQVTVTTTGSVGVFEPPAEGFERVAETMPLSPSEVDWFLDRSEQLDGRLPDFLQRLTTDPAFAEQVPLAPDASVDRLDPESAVWVHVLCGKYRRILLGSEVVQHELVDDVTRERLCEMRQRLEEGAVAVDLGPAPG